MRPSNFLIVKVRVAQYLFFLLLLSCGNSSNILDFLSSKEQSSSSCLEESSKVNRLLRESRLMTTEIKRSLDSYQRLNGVSFNRSQAKIHYYGSSSPLELNYQELKNNLDKLKSKVEKKFPNIQQAILDKTGVRSQTLLTKMEKNKEQEIAQIEQDLFLTNTLIERFSYYNCNKRSIERVKDGSVGGYLNFGSEYCGYEKNKNCLSNRLGNWNNLKKIEKSDWTRQGVDICKKHEGSSQVCLQKLNLAIARGEVWDFYDYYLDRYSEYMRENFFSLTRNVNKFECSKLNSFTLMRVALYIKQGDFPFVDRGILASTIENIWSQGKGFELKITFSDRLIEGEVVHIKPIEGGISYVKEEDSMSIFMAKNISESSFYLTLAHELGHVFGFPDCYLTLRNNEKKSFIYYELDQHNFMCSQASQSHLPQSYFDQLSEQVCY